MSTSKNWKNCIWFDQCHEDEVCEGYEPASLDEQEAIDIEAYQQDIDERHKVYSLQVEEQDD